MRVLITGAAGNLGSRLARHLLHGPHQLVLLTHHRPIAQDIASRGRTEVRQADLGNPQTLTGICQDVDCIVHLAGVLFAPRPERFLPKTNIGFVRNLLASLSGSAVKKFILVSFPHVEGETTPEHPATDRLHCDSPVLHFRTRLAAEKCVLEDCRKLGVTPIILRAGIVYGRGVKLIVAARWLLRHHLLAVWSRKTWIHLVSLPDFLSAVEAAIGKEDAHGIYNVCDDEPITLQYFLDTLAVHFGYSRPWRLPAWMFHAAGLGCESIAGLLGVAAPLTRDIVRAGMTSSVADNSRCKRELVAELAYPSLRKGLELL